MVGEERDGEQPPPRRVTDRDLLWVESVSERLLGTSAPRAWERAFFQTDDEDDRLDTPTAPSPPVAPAPPEQSYAPAPEYVPEQQYVPGVPDAPARDHVPAPLRYTDGEPTGSPSYPGPGASYEAVARYFSEGDADWRHDLGPEFPDEEGDDEVLPAEDADESADEDGEPDLVIDLTQPVRPEPPDGVRAGPGVDDEILRLALVSGDTVLATAVLQLLEDRARDRQRIATLVTTLGALVEVVDRIDAPDHELAVTARLLRRVVGR